MAAIELKGSKIWRHGPAFLMQKPSEWPKSKIEKGADVLTEVKSNHKSSHISMYAIKSTDEGRRKMTWGLKPERWSNLKRLSHTLAWVFRFLHNVRSPDKDRQTTNVLTPEEVEEADKWLIRDAQQKEFGKELICIQNGKSLPVNNPLVKLMPKIDEDGLLRSDGRLCYAEFLPYDVRYPIILPRGAWITKLIVKYYHELGRHITGTNHILSNLSSKCWIVAAREVIRAWENECCECKRRRAKAAHQVMAPLPKTRVSPPLKSFSRIAINYGGPFITVQGRGKRREKRWLCLFTCLLSRAVHLEMAYGLDTDSFLRCLSRMVS